MSQPEFEAPLTTIQRVVAAAFIEVEALQGLSGLSPGALESIGVLDDIIREAKELIDDYQAGTPQIVQAQVRAKDKNDVGRQGIQSPVELRRRVVRLPDGYQLGDDNR